MRETSTPARDWLFFTLVRARYYNVLVCVSHTGKTFSLSSMLRDGRPVAFAPNAKAP